MPDHDHDCPVSRMERAVANHVAELTEALADRGWEPDRATRYIANRLGRAAREGLAIGNAGIAASATIREEQQ